MIRLTTPTLTVRVDSGQLEAAHCKAYGTFAQGGKALTLEPTSMISDVENDVTRIRFDLTQLQTGGFNPGTVHIQVNVIDWMGYRAATIIGQRYIGTNLQKEVLEYA